MGRKMTKRELLETFDEALREGHIYPVYQAQINHSTKRMVGAEALMRWNSPKYGTQYPSDFIPVLEKNDLLYRADVHMFESVCRFQRQRLDKSLPTVPISVNMSRFDIYHHEYADEIEAIRKRFDIPVKYLRIEITESAAIGGMELMTAVIKQLHGFGYVVEMDDFGSGYSSLNILKNLDVDIIKLDLGFLGDELGGRGGVILSTVVQMAKWLGTPLIAEGVETLEQADYMKSLGCYYMQGYLYAKPVPETDFAEQLDKTEHEPSAPAMRLADAISSGKFRSPDSMEELIFNNFIGAAALFTYQAGDVDILRVNENYLQETGMNMNTKDFVTSNPWNSITEDNRIVYEDTIRKAAVSGKEETCETWRHLYSSCCGDDTILSAATFASSARPRTNIWSMRGCGISRQKRSVTKNYTTVSADSVSPASRRMSMLGNTPSRRKKCAPVSAACATCTCLPSSEIIRSRCSSPVFSRRTMRTYIGIGCAVLKQVKSISKASSR
ncbi:MAG: EAL domain-containing protein [Schwartzia sp.]|nr:EAL domain-containing protein [Schwartzia sp. (in: firmicutes)]